MMDNFKRIFVVGSLPAYHYRTGAEISAPLWVKILYIDGRLSITGVHGPLRNGEAHGDCGQVTERLAELLKFPDLICVEGGTETVRRLLDYWEEWHLNSMRAHCDHQIAVHNWDVKERVQLWRWQLEGPPCAGRERSKTRRRLACYRVRRLPTLHRSWSFCANLLRFGHTTNSHPATATSWTRPPRSLSAAFGQWKSWARGSTSPWSTATPKASSPNPAQPAGISGAVLGSTRTCRRRCCNSSLRCLTTRKTTPGKIDLQITLQVHNHSNIEVQHDALDQLQRPYPSP